MEVIKGFEKVSYKVLQESLKECIKEQGKSYVDVAASAGTKSVQSIHNIFGDEQIVSDTLLAKVFDIAGFKAIITHDATGRNYFMEK